MNIFIPTLQHIAIVESMEYSSLKKLYTTALNLDFDVKLMIEYLISASKLPLNAAKMYSEIACNMIGDELENIYKSPTTLQINLN